MLLKSSLRIPTSAMHKSRTHRGFISRPAANSGRTARLCLMHRLITEEMINIELLHNIALDRGLTASLREDVFSQKHEHVSFLQGQLLH